jgi:hypothetical protein
MGTEKYVRVVAVVVEFQKCDILVGRYIFADFPDT